MRTSVLYGVSRSGSTRMAARAALPASANRPAVSRRYRERLSGRRAQVAPLLALRDDPSVEPVGQQLTGQGRDRGRGEVAVEDRRVGVEQPVGECLRLDVVDVHDVGEAEGGATPRRSPRGRAPRAGRAPTGGSRPACSAEASGHIAAATALRETVRSWRARKTRRRCEPTGKPGHRPSVHRDREAAEHPMSMSMKRRCLVGQRACQVARPQVASTSCRSSPGQTEFGCSSSSSSRSDRYRSRFS